MAWRLTRSGLKSAPLIGVDILGHQDGCSSFLLECERDGYLDNDYCTIPELLCPFSPRLGRTLWD
jgi:hypothetical protein